MVATVLHPACVIGLPVPKSPTTRSNLAAKKAVNWQATRHHSENPMDRVNGYAMPRAAKLEAAAERLQPWVGDEAQTSASSGDLKGQANP